MADSDDESPLHDAASRNDVKRLRRLLSQGADPNLRDPREEERGRTPLHHLCLGYSYDGGDKKRSAICFELLRAAGADVNARDYRLNVPGKVRLARCRHHSQGRRDGKSQGPSRFGHGRQAVQVARAGLGL